LTYSSDTVRASICRNIGASCSLLRSSGRIVLSIMWPDEFRNHPETYTESVDTVVAVGHFLRTDVCQDNIMSQSISGKILEACIEPRLVDLRPLPSNAHLETHGVEMIDAKGDLLAAGITETNFDPASSEHRQRVGEVLLAIAEARFGPNLRVVQLPNASHVVGSAPYGECTVRCAGNVATFRKPFHAFHIDKFLPGVARFWHSGGDKSVGAQDFVDTHWTHWEPLFSQIGLTKGDVVNCLIDSSPGLVNMWVSLTQDAIQQHPLAFMEQNGEAHPCVDIQNSVGTIKIVSETLKDSLNHIVSSHAAGV